MPPKMPRPSPTHFLCLPLITEYSRPAMEMSMNIFKTEILDGSAKYNLTSLNGSIVRPIGTLHLTLGVMSLRDEEKFHAARQLLQHELDISTLLKGTQTETHSLTAANETELSASQDVSPLSISLRSIMPMQSSTNSSVLYTAPVDVSNRLLPFCQNIKSEFEKRGLLVSDSRPLKLHATIVNTIYGSNQQRGKSRSGPVRFDASTILKEFEGMEWTGEYQLEKLAICKMGAKKVFDEDGNIVDEAYEEVATRDLPR